MELLPLAGDGHHVTTQETEYAPCMFCTARCFKLHGHGAARPGVGSKTGHEASGSSPPRGGRDADVLSPDEVNAGGKSKHRQPFFVKTVKASTVSSRTNCELHLPAFFFRHYGDRFQRLVLLRGPSGQVWPVSLCVSCATGTGRPTVRFSRGWKQFAFNHNLELGDKLIFTLVSFSRFTVQLFDGYGKTKPATSEMADSGWTFQREGGNLQNHGVQVSKQKRSFYVNWKDRVVREQSAAGTSGMQESKKGNIQLTKTSLLYRHLKRGEKKKLGRKSGAMVLFRPRKQQEGKVRVLGQKLMIKQTDSHSSDDDEEDSETLFTEFLDAAGGEMVEWEPFENTSSSAQTWPGFGNPSTSAAIGCKSKPTRPKSSSLVLDCSNNSLIAEELPQNFRNEDAQLFPAKVKMEEDTDMHTVFRVDPISSMAPLEGENVQEAPASPTISFSHYLHPTQPEEEEEEEAHSNHGESHVLKHQYSPHKTVKSEPDSVAADERMESYGISCLDKPLVLRSDSDGFVDEKPFHRDFSLSRDLVEHSGKVSKQSGGASDHEIDTHEGGSRLSEKWGVQNSSSDVRIASAPKPSKPSIPPTFPERCSNDPAQACHNRTVINVDGAVSMPDSSNPTGSRTPESPSRAAAPTGRKDLSLAYFLNQPRPNVRKQNPQEKKIELKSSDGSHQEKNVAEMRPTDTDLSPMCADHLQQADELRDAAAPKNNSVSAPHVAAHVHEVHGSYNVQQNSDTHDKSSGSRNFQRNSESKSSSEALSRRFADTSVGIDRPALLPRSNSAPVRPTESNNDFPTLLDHLPKTELKFATKANSVTPHGTPGSYGDCNRSDDVTTRQCDKSSNRSFQRSKSALGDPERYSNSINRSLPWSDTELAENKFSPTSVDHSPQTDFEHALQANSVKSHNTQSYDSNRGYKHDIGVSLKSGDHMRQAGLKGTKSVNPEPISMTTHHNVAAHTIVRGSDGEYTRPDVHRRFDDKSNSRGNLQDNHLLSKSSSPRSSSPAWSDHTEYDTDDFSLDSVDHFKRQSTDFGDDDSFKSKPVTTTHTPVHSSDREYKQTRIDEYLTLRKFRRAAGRCSAKDHTSGIERPMSWSDADLRPSTDVENLRREEFKGVIPKRNPASDGEFMRPDVQTRLGDKKNCSGNFQELNLNPNSNSRGGASRCSAKDHTSGIERPRPWSDAELRPLADLEYLRQEELKSSPKRNPVNVGEFMRPDVQTRFGDRKNSIGSFQELNLNPNFNSRGGAGRCFTNDHTSRVERPRPWSDAELTPLTDPEHFRQEESKGTLKRNSVNDGEFIRPDVPTRLGERKNSSGNFQELNVKPHPNSRAGGAGRCFTGIDMKPSPCASAARNADTVSKPLDSANEFSVLHYLADRKLQKRTYKKRIREDVNSLPTHHQDSHTTFFGRGPRVSESLQRKDNRSAYPNSWSKDCKRAPTAKSSRDENCPVISQEDAWLSEYLEQDPVAKRTTPKMKQSMRSQMVNLPVEQLRKLRPAWTYNIEQQAHEAAPRTMKMGSRDDDKCQLIELDNISSSDDDDAPTLARGGAQDGWDTWMDIFRKNAVVS